MFQISLKNNKTFSCDGSTTIFEAAKANKIFLEHSCLTARCRSCVVKIQEGSTKNKLDETVLSEEEKQENFVLSCNAFPTSDLKLDVEDLGDIEMYEKRIVPSKIQSIDYLTEDVVKVVLRTPPALKFKFNSGQYVNISKGAIKRSYSVANNSVAGSPLEFFIKKYEGGQMSQYWFDQAKQNDLLRIEGPLGTFFLRNSEKENIIFLATGTGIAPIKSILEELEASDKDYSNKTFWLFLGARYEKDLFWKPAVSDNINLKFIPVISRKSETWKGFVGYVQDAVLNEGIDLANAQVYACGSNNMIESARKLLTENSLSENDFFSDAFICTN